MTTTNLSTTQTGVNVPSPSLFWLEPFQWCWSSVCWSLVWLCSLPCCGWERVFWLPLECDFFCLITPIMKPMWNQRHFVTVHMRNDWFFLRKTKQDKTKQKKTKKQNTRNKWELYSRGYVFMIMQKIQPSQGSNACYLKCRLFIQWAPV